LLLSGLPLLNPGRILAVVQSSDYDIEALGTEGCGSSTVALDCVKEKLFLADWAFGVFGRWVFEI
jgi:hypothetical protein